MNESFVVVQSPLCSILLLICRSHRRCLNSYHKQQSDMFCTLCALLEYWYLPYISSFWLHLKTLQGESPALYRKWSFSELYIHKRGSVFEFIAYEFDNLTQTRKLVFPCSNNADICMHIKPGTHQLHNCPRNRSSPAIIISTNRRNNFKLCAAAIVEKVLLSQEHITWICSCDRCSHQSQERTAPNYNQILRRIMRFGGYNYLEPSNNHKESPYGQW